MFVHGFHRCRGVTTFSTFLLTLRYTRDFFTSGGASYNIWSIIESAVRFAFSRTRWVLAVGYFIHSRDTRYVTHTSKYVVDTGYKPMLCKPNCSIDRSLCSISKVCTWVHNFRLTSEFNVLDAWWIHEWQVRIGLPRVRIWVSNSYQTFCAPSCCNGVFNVSVDFITWQKGPSAHGVSVQI